ncbi:MAG TPA: NADP-dependent oxidoreductase [Acidobacteriota bacterium]|nr:NADP-dependent oxidoreductase [Acidobacteriota bacterium]
MNTLKNRMWCLASRPVGLAKTSDFTWSEVAVPEVMPGQLRVRNVYLSLDPTNRGWINPNPTYMPPVQIGEVVRGLGLGVVEESRNPSFNEGDLVQGLLGWQVYQVSDGEGLSSVPRSPSLPLTAYLGALGHIGLTAYFGLLDIGKPKAGETLVVTAAAGAVGSLVGQIGKMKGCRVVGIAGSDEKCNWLKEDLGFDSTINYKSANIEEALREACPDGIDVDFENVGGRILDTILGQINLRARIVVCGLISQYNATRPVAGPYNFPNVLIRRARVEGFIVLDYLDRSSEALSEMAEWLVSGKLKYRVEVVQGVESAPTALNKLFDGSHTGKLIVQVSAEP